MIAVGASRSIRTNELASDGSVFPNAWNVLETTKMIPEATKFHDTMRR